MAGTTEIIGAAGMIGREWFHTTGGMAGQTVIATFQGMGNLGLCQSQAGQGKEQDYAQQ